MTDRRLPAQRLAQRLVRHVVLGADPAVPQIAADFWAHSVPHYRSVAAAVRAVAATSDPVARALAAVLADPAAGIGEPALIDALADAPLDVAALTAIVDAADAEILIGYHRGDRYARDAAPATLDELRDWAAQGYAAPAVAPELLVVIPIRDRVAGARIRNLLATLLALRDQSLEPSRYHVTVVEADTEARWRDVVEPLVDSYVFVRNDGLFNKSWAMNVGVATTAPGAGRICVLDADILVDRNFLARNLRRSHEDPAAAHIPYRDCFSLDEPSTDRALRDRLRRGDDDVTADVLRALVLRDPPGGCLWTTRATYDAVGGYDERYVGWGGEDDDMWARLGAAGPVRRYDDQFLHLSHPRPVMTVDGQPINGEREFGTWVRDHGWGSLDGPSGAHPVPAV
jgi:hypothetical protein